jgi:hypothetical protein
MPKLTVEWTPLNLTSLTRNKVDKDKREQQVARMDSKVLPNNSQQEDRSRPVSSKTCKDHLYFSHFDTLDQLVSLKLDISRYTKSGGGLYNCILHCITVHCTV